MAKHSCKQICLLVVILSISSSWLCESRPLYLSGSSEGIETFIGELNIAVIKTGGPSGGGEANGFGNAETLGERKTEGPSDGGEGHDFHNAEILGGRKSGGPSASGKGHEFKNSKILGTHPQSGPSPGEGH